MTTDAAPTPLAERALGPDLARGFMLLFIALANSHYFLTGPAYRGGFPTDGGGLDRVVSWVVATFVDGRAFPMFGLMFGYGVAQIVRRQAALGPKGTRRLLRRRALVLIVVGFLHCLLLYAGDILTAYGVLLLFGAWLVRWRDRWLLLVAGLMLVLISMPSADSLSIGTEAPDASMLPPDLVTQLTERPWVSGFIGLLGPVGFLAPFAVGLVLGRRRIFERPEGHRRFLTVGALVGIAVAALGAQPAALWIAGVTGTPSGRAFEYIGPLHDVTGVFGGFGYACLIALVALRLRDRRGRVVDAVAAVGQRSMTCYLAQSPVWAIVFTPYLLDLSGTLSIAATALLAVATWTATVVLGGWMGRTGRRGPFELLVRKVTYRDRRVATPAPLTSSR